MATLRILAVVLAVSSAAWSVNPGEPCYGEGCTNFTLFLGPRFGSKTLRLPIPNYPKLKGPNVEEVKNEMNSSNDMLRIEPIASAIERNQTEAKYQTTRDNIKPTTIVRALFPRHRPVPEDGNLAVEYLDVDKARLIFGTDESNRTNTVYNSTAIDNVNQLLDSGFLNLTGFGFTGEQLKQVLYNLSSSSKLRLRHLILSRNQVWSLPMLFFPVELEYGLQELCLDDNPLVRFDTTTLFELSRLIRLKKLSLARTGLHYMVELPHIHSLEVLDLSGNMLSSYPALTDSFPHLLVLNLSDNNISYLEYYDSSNNLQILNLASNGLKTVRGHSIVNNMPFLQTLNLFNNSLKYSSQIEDLTFGVTLYLAGNPWECSCPLVRVVHQHWPLIKDREALRCTDDNISVPWPVMSLSEANVTVACPARGVKSWLKVIGLKFDDLYDWFHYNITFSVIFNFLWWALLIVTAVTVVRIQRHQKKESSPSTIPYTVLDDKVDNQQFI